ncbi:hypothetical protein IFM89_022794 [Coptis chinensis]|uniref:DM2 domain-containing protein n=1 Tax=Coptis chinensis TaxID=261450 RepID=A0A835I4M6_9MAGN|nr:hypothetical protein IFM89_022794 [Coptis chinensis]
MMWDLFSLKLEKAILDVNGWGEFDFKNEAWMSFCQELPTGSSLIIGLRFPSDLKGASVSKFIHEVLKVKPKLLILICPRTRRLKDIESTYDLIWEDCEFFSSKSYVRETTCSGQQRKFRAPMLSLYSWRGWTNTHKSTALKQGHLPNEQKDLGMEVKHREAEVSTEPTDMNWFTDLLNQINNLPDVNSEAEELAAQSVSNQGLWPSTSFAPGPFVPTNGSFGWLEE